MSEFQHIDEFVKGKLAQRDHVFKDSYWEAAEKLILADKKRKKRRYLIWLWLTTGGMSLILVLAGLWGISEDNNSFLNPIASGTEGGFPLALNEEECTDEADLNAIKKTSWLSSQFETVEENVQVSIESEKEKKAKVDKSAKREFSVLAIDNGNLKLARKRPNQSVLSPSQEFRRQSIRMGQLYRLNGKAVDLSFPIDIQTVELDQARDSLNWKRHSFGFELGAQSQRDWGFSESNNLTTTNIRPVIGLKYSYMWKPGFRLQTGLRYWSRGGVNLDTTIFQTSFAFGLDQRAIQIRSNSLHYLEIPLALDMRVWNRHYLMVGGSVSSLLNVRGREQIREISDFEENIVSERNVWNYRRGFRTWQSGVQVGYAYYLGYGMRLGLQGYYSWQDNTDMNYFHDTRTDDQFHLRAILQVDLYHR